MSFLKALEEARSKAREDLKKIIPVDIVEETNINTPVEEEVTTENKTDNSFITLGDAIIEQSINAIERVKKSKLKGPSGAARRIAKAIAAKNIRLSQLNKAFAIQKKFSDKRSEWHVVGGYALEQLRKKLDKGMPLNEALNSPFERNLI